MNLPTLAALIALLAQAPPQPHAPSAPAAHVERVENGGLLFTDKSDLCAIAGVAALLLADGALRDTLLEGQRRRFESLRDLGELERSA